MLGNASNNRSCGSTDQRASQSLFALMPDHPTSDSANCGACNGVIGA